MIVRAWEWLTDPNHQGRKRGIAAAAIVLVGTIRAVGAGVAYACTSTVLSGTACGLDFGSYASVVESINTFIQTVVVPGADFTAVLFGLWGLISARSKAKDQAVYVSPRP